MTLQRKLEMLIMRKNTMLVLYNNVKDNPKRATTQQKILESLEELEVQIETYKHLLH